MSEAARWSLALACAALVAACSPTLPVDATGHRPGAALPGDTFTQTAEDRRLSGFHFMSGSTQDMQRDDTQNPAFLWVNDGRARFDAACSACHDAPALSGAAARYPVFDPATQRPITLAGRIRQCQSDWLKQHPAPWESDALLALESYVAYLSRGQPIAPAKDQRLDPFVADGERLWRQRFGQIDLACADCHDALAGRRLAGSTITQAHPTGYPIYRLEWQGPGSLQRRMRGCMTGVRAEPFAYGAPEWSVLELYLKRRAAGMPIETPAVRP